MWRHEKKKSPEQLRAEREAREARIRERKEEDERRKEQGLRPKDEIVFLAIIYILLCILIFGFFFGGFNK